MAYALIGRESERELLLARLAASKRGDGSLVVVEGEGGTGKSTLVASLLEAARAGGHHVLHARAWELSASVPYESLVAAVSRHLRSRSPDDVVRLTAGLPTLGALIEWLDLQPSVGGAEAFKVRAQDALATLIARIGADRAVVLALDDLHWADQASIEVLQYLCLDLPDAPLLVVATTRPDEAELRPELRHLIAGLRRAPWTSVIRLGRFDRTAIDAIVAARLGGAVTPRVYELIAGRSGGTPLLVHELLDDLVDRGMIVKDREVWRMDVDEAPLARSATDLIRARLDRVEHHDRAVLEALAVINAPTDPSIVAALVGIDADDVERSLERLRGNRLAIETEPDPSGSAAAVWTVEHPVIAEVVEGALVDAARRRLHRRLLVVDANAPIGRRARHALVAGDPTDRIATIALLADAGTEALMRAAPSAAIDPLRGALALLQPGEDALRHRIERDLGVAHLRQLEVDPALSHLRSAWQQAQQAANVTACFEVLHPLDNAEFRAGNGGVSAAALEWLRSTVAASQSWELLVELGWVYLSHAGRDRSAVELDRAAATLDIVPAASMPPRGDALREILSAYVDSALAERSAGQRVEQFLDAAARWQALPDVAHRCVLLAYDAAMLSGDRTLAARCQAIHEGVQETTGEPPTWRAPMVEGLRNIAEGRLEERPADLRLFGARNRSEVVDTVIGALATRYVEGPDAALVLLDRELAALGLDGDRTARLYGAFGRLMVAIGTPDETALARAAVAEIGADQRMSSAAGFPFGGAATLARGLAGDGETVVSAIDELDRVGTGRWLPSAWACVVRARLCSSSAHSAVELLRAADILRSLGRCLEEAERTVDAAEADLDAVDNARLGSAFEIARQAGATWLVARVEAIAPSGRTRNWARAADGALTSRELEVVELVVGGLTNREIGGRLFISIRTVTSHLDHIYTKLGLSSREALAAWQRANA